MSVFNKRGDFVAILSCWGEVTTKNEQDVIECDSDTDVDTFNNFSYTFQSLL